MPLDDLAHAMLVAIERVTRGTYAHADGPEVLAELQRQGVQLPEDYVLIDLARWLMDNGYLEDRASFAHEFESVGLLQLTQYGQEVAHEVDPFERTQTETRRLLASDQFRAAYPGAFEPWADAEGLLWADDAGAELTTIGHKIREAMQAFATAMVAEHQPPGVDPDPAHARARLGAVIAAERGRLGDARRTALEALGDLWEANDGLVQRQEHGAQKKGEPVTWTDARRLVWLTMFLMVEFVNTFEDLPAPRVAHIEGG
jgi:hypothetical protein